MDVIARRFIVNGRVQGVGYRYFVRQKAELLGLQGSVKNNYDGSVEVFVQGREKDIQQFKLHLKQGPPMARVNNILENNEPVDPTLDSFRVGF